MDRFEDKVYYGLDGCWYWIGHINRKGYGAFRYRGKMDKSHRVSFILYKGEISNGLCVLHTCDNPSCVNPDHLFLGSNADNVIDKVSKNRQHRPIGERHPKARLTTNQVLNIRANHGLVKGKDLAKKYGVSVDYIFEIWARKSWTHI